MQLHQGGDAAGRNGQRQHALPVARASSSPRITGSPTASSRTAPTATRSRTRSRSTCGRRPHPRAPVRSACSTGSRRTRRRPGTLLDKGVCAWMNDLSNGPPHSISNLPYVVAGRRGRLPADGGVRRRQATSPHNKLLNTVWRRRSGLRKGGGEPVDDFGHASLERGLIDRDDRVIAGTCELRILHFSGILFRHECFGGSAW